MAVLAWAEVLRSRQVATSIEVPNEMASTPTDKTGDVEFQRQKTDECQQWLDKVAAWETFGKQSREPF
jgi:hypothetical protein